MKILIALIALLTVSCSKDEAPAWTDAQFTSAVNACIAEIMSPPARTTNDRASSYCNCIITEVKGRWTSAQYSADDVAIVQQLDREGKVTACSR